MSPWKAAALAALLCLGALGAVATPAQAHTCSSSQSGGCGPCTSGQDHEHQEPNFSCSSTGPDACGDITVHDLIDCAHETVQGLIDWAQDVVRDLIGPGIRLPVEVAVRDGLGAGGPRLERAFA